MGIGSVKGENDFVNGDVEIVSCCWLSWYGVCLRICTICGDEKHKDEGTAGYPGMAHLRSHF